MELFLANIDRLGSGAADIATGDPRPVATNSGALRLRQGKSLLAVGAYFVAPTACPGWPPEIRGFIVHLEWEPGTGRPGLRAVLDLVSGSTAVSRS